MSYEDILKKLSELEFSAMDKSRTEWQIIRIIHELNRIQTISLEWLDLTRMANEAHKSAQEKE